MKGLSQERLRAIFIGTLIVFFGVILLSNRNDKMYTEKEFNKIAKPVEAYVEETDSHTEMKRSNRRRRRRAGRSYKKVTVYTATVTYEVNGIKYTNVKIEDEDDVINGIKTMKEGEYHTIYYNPNNPEYAKAGLYDIEENNNGMIAFSVLLILGGLFVIFAFGVLKKN